MISTMYKIKHSYLFGFFVIVSVSCISCSSSHKINQNKDANLRKVASEGSRYLSESGFNCEGRIFQTSVGTDLHRLVIKKGWGSLASVRKAIEEGADVNAPDSLRLTPLHWAVWCRKSSSVLTLVENGADVHIEDVNGNTPLHLALRPDKIPNPSLIERLLDSGADISTQNKDGNTYLHLLAVNISYADTVRVFNNLFKNVASLEVLNTQNNEGYTPLHLAIKNLSREDSRSFIDQLIKAEASVDTVAKDGHTPLSTAITSLNQDNYNDVPILVKMLVDAGADVNFEDKNGNNLLHLLIDRLRSLSEWGFITSIRIIKYLVDARIIINSTDKDGNTPLHLAVNPGITRAELVVKELIKGRPTLNARGQGGNTPLHFAAATGHSRAMFEAVKELLKEGANPKIRNDDGLYPFQMIDIEAEGGIRGYRRRIYNSLYFDVTKQR